MASTGHEGPFSDDSSKEHTLVLPAEGNYAMASNSSRPSSTSNTTTTNPADSAPNPTTTGGDQKKSWKPSFNRQQSWNEQDMKHQMQSRLLRTEKGKESGFSEMKS